MFLYFTELKKKIFSKYYNEKNIINVWYVTSNPENCRKKCIR